jgi:hypothetical protein
MAIPKKLRFEILKRDEFRCRYCGRTEADGVKLHVDHVIAIALGGRNDPDNLATACADCNLGKSANLLSDPKLIGVDFEARAQLFRDAHASLERYREYIREKDRWERALISEAIAPLREAMDLYPFWDTNPMDSYWLFDYVPKDSDYPPGYDEIMRSVIADNLEKAEERVRRSVMHFIRHLGVDAVREAAVTANRRVILDMDTDGVDAADVFRYFSGICHRKIRGEGSR